MILAPSQSPQSGILAPGVRATPRTTITRLHQPGCDLAIARQSGMNELHITLQPLPGENPAQMLLRLEEILSDHQAVVTRMEVFGSRQASPSFLGTMRRLLSEPCWPVMWLDGASVTREPVAGMHVMAVTGVDVETVQLDDRIVGTTFNDGYARHCLLGDLLPSGLRGSRSRQAREVFENMARALEVVDMQPADIARTWLFLDDLLAWYGALNRERTQIFQEWNLFDSGVPASTGIGAKNPHGAAMVAGAWATVPLNGSATVREVVSPLQCPAGSYGSSFARAMEWTTPAQRRLTVSGTASIAPGGASLYQDNIRAQVDLTMEVVEAILASRGASFQDVTRATAYIKHPQHGAALEEWFERTGNPWFAAVPTHTQVCRDELLFEIELDTLVPRHGAPLRA
jgi:enamine deaminase RidA (YjgF/YER057c/UK114 family)